MSLFKIAGGTVYDPPTASTARCATSGSTAAESCRPRPTPRCADAHDRRRGLVVMPGGIDMHCHIAGPKVNVARKMRPEDKREAEPVRRTPLTRSGTLGSVPSTFATGYKYAGLGYTTAFDAAIPPLAARHAHEEFADTPCIDKGFYVLMGNNHYVMRPIQRRRARAAAGVRRLAARRRPRATRPSSSTPAASKSGRAAARQRPRPRRRRRRTSTSRRGRSFRASPQAADELQSAAPGPHPLQQPRACPATGRPRSKRCRPWKAIGGHLTHIQFHSYGGGDGDENTFNSQSRAAGRVRQRSTRTSPSTSARCCSATRPA